MPVAIALAIRLIVLVGVGHKVGQREAVMAGDVVDGGGRKAAVLVELFGRSQQSFGKIGRQPLVPAPEFPHPVAEKVVPFVERMWKAAQPVAAKAHVPGFRDQLDAGQDRVLPDRVEKGAAGVEPAFAPRQRAGKVKAEAIDMHHLHPIAKRIHHHPQHHRMGEVQRIAGAGVVDIVPRVLGQPVIAAVVEAPEAERRAEFIALAGMVVDHVEDDLDPSPVQAAHHGLKLPYRALAHVARLRREEADGLVAPVIAQAPRLKETVVDEGLHRQQFHRRDAKLQQVVDHRVRA